MPRLSAKEHVLRILEREVDLSHEEMLDLELELEAMGDDQLGLLDMDLGSEIHDKIEETEEDILLLSEMRSRVAEKRYFEQRFLGSAGRVGYDLLESYWPSRHYPSSIHSE